MNRILFYHRFLFLFFILLSSFSSFAQKTQAQSDELKKRIVADPAVKEVEFSKVLKTPSFISFQPGIPAKATVEQTLRNYFEVSPSNEIRLINSSTTKGNLTIDRYKQFYKGLPVVHSAYVVLSKGGKVISVSAESYPINESFSAVPVQTADFLRTKALDFVRASKYAWEAIEEDMKRFAGNKEALDRLEKLRIQYFPQGDLVIAKDVYGDGQAHLAYMFDVFAVEPIGRYKIYVDAQTGKILLSDAVIKHADKIKRNPLEIVKDIPNFLYYNLASLETVTGPLQANASLLTTGQTRYAGTRNIYTTKVEVLFTANDPNNPNAPLQYSGVDPRVPVTGPATVYILKDDTRGGGVATYDCNAVGGAPLSLPGVHDQALAFVDRDNIWKDELTPGTQEDLIRGATSNGSVGADEARNDDIAIDAHWGAEMVYDYWKQVHNRLSYDNKNTSIRSYIHYGPAYDNAFWNGSVMTYGDGSGTAVNSGFRPLVSLDVCGHEIGHGVCSFTADLVYEKESGAMNEGLSDIWAACVERFVKVNVDATLNYQEFQIGEQIAADNIGLRRMDNPKAKTDPDTYGGRYFQPINCTPTLANDQCGVHTNSGVLNKWFYLMVKGPNSASGSPSVTDDGRADAGTTVPLENIGNNYGILPEFIGLGFDKAEAITYLMELSLTPNATFADARIASINAAKVLYGQCSQEVQTVTDAWFGVNVGAAWAGCTAPPLSVNILRSTVTEGSGDCGSFSEYTIGVSVVSNTQPATTINFTGGAGSTAEPHDYEFSPSSVTFNAGETGNKTVILRIFNDDMVEGTETIDITTTSTNPLGNTTNTITILDDDVLPRLGNTFTLLTENFETVADDALPTDWVRVDKTNPSGGVWNVRQTPGASTITWLTKRAYVYNPNLPTASKGQALYDPNVASQIILRTKLIDGRGLDSIRLQFVWSAGGETACAPACDYGDVVYSLDGINFNRFDSDTTGTTGGASEPLFLSPIDSTYDQILPEVVSNKQFYLGFQWTNDALLTLNPNSITIDNIVVTGQGRKIETDSASAVTTPVRVEPGNPIFFYSEDDKGLLSKMINASADLGCVKDTLIQTGNGVVPYSGGLRSRKVFDIAPLVPNTSATYTLTLYLTTAELTGFAPPFSNLRILKSNAANIDQSNLTNSVIVTPILIDSSAQGFYGFEATFTGFSKFAIVSPGVVLPVNLTTFNAVKQEQHSKLTWVTTGEINLSNYSVERSADGVIFTAIGSVNAIGSINQQTYYFEDNQPLKGKNFYRLKMINTDGTFKYSTIRTLNFDRNNIFVMSPNPAQSSVTLQFDEVMNNATIRISNQQGQVVKQLIMNGSDRTDVNVSDLAAGVYLVNVTSGSFRQLSKLVISRY
ncbi:MAG: M4 family metallopeptidase [Ferruginibacter sp.]